MAATTPLNELNINILTQEQYNSAVKDPNQLYMITDYEEEKYELPVANASTLGGIKSGGDISIDTSGIVSVNDDSHNHVISNIDNLQSTLDTKATIIYVDEQLTNKVDKVSGKGLSTNDYTTTEKNKLAGIATGAEVNQNAFSNIIVGSTTIVADTETDSLTIAAGTGISVSGDATNDKVTITNSGVRSISTGGSNGTISVNTNGTSADVAVKGLGSAAYTASTAYDAAGTAQTKSDAALSSAKSYTDTALATAKSYADTAAATIKSDLLNGAGTAYDTLKELGDLIDVNVDAIDALETVAASKASAADLTSHTSNKSNPHSVTLEQLGVTATAAELNIMDGVTATTAEINKLDGVTATTAELNYVDGVTSNIQTQLNGKAPTSHASTATTYGIGTGSNFGHVKLSDSVSSTSAASSGIAASPAAVKSAYDLANTAKTHADSAHAPSDAEKNQNAFSNIVVGTTTITAESTTDTLTIVPGSNISITTDAENDKITITAQDTTYTLDSFGITATADELNYVDGVTSSIQVQLDEKASSSHTHNEYAASSHTHSEYAASSHTHDYLPLSGGTVTGVTSFTNTTASTSKTTGAVKISGGLGVAGSIYGNAVYGAMYNDYAEYRQTTDEVKPGYVVIENGDDTLSFCTGRLMPGAEIVSDTFGFAIGESDSCKTPIAVSGRVLAYPYEDRYSYRPGDPVCSGPDGTVSKMTREEIREYPDRMIGTVSAIPEYKIWGTNNVDVDGRIWIRVK